MNKFLKPAAGFLVISFCIFMGCERKEEQGELLEPVSFAETGEELSGVSSEPDAVESGTAADGRAEIPAEKEMCVVHVCGAVHSPGVYTLEEGSRIYQAVEAAGGFTEDAGADYLNQADRISDGMKIYVPDIEELSDTAWQEISGGTSEDKGDGLININTADEELLCTLSGVGSSRAKSIIAYREEHGAYQKIEDIMNVEGIKEGLFQKIRDNITV
ncbi:MAG: helix-hairpin-helix domain-containing protein [Lachnospiraceae bacterium]|nr:helix-hairpin-helix domain-containing protein [Lachnospiraceae bacterium]